MTRGEARQTRRSSGWITWLLLALAGGLTTLTMASAVRAQDELPADQSAVQVVHAAPAIGTVDLYIDGAIVLVGLTFGAVSDPLLLPAGEREVRVAPSGRSRDEALATVTVTMAAGLTADLALFGSAEQPRLGLYPVDLTPLPPELARLGAVLGSPDTGPMDLAFTGGDLLFPTIDYAGATEFADVAVGAYDLEVRYAGTTNAALLLPGTVLEAGLVYTLYIVGEAVIGDLQPLLVGRPAESVTLVGHPAWVQSGGCDAEGASTVAELVIVAESPFAERSGHPAAAVTESSFTAIGVPYSALIEQPHAIVVAESKDAATVPVACGEIGGTQTVDGSLVVGLRAQPGATAAGIAVLSPNVLDPEITDVSVFIADGLLDEPAPAGEIEIAPAPGAAATVEPAVVGVELAAATPALDN